MGGTSDIYAGWKKQDPNGRKERWIFNISTLKGGERRRKFFSRMASKKDGSKESCPILG